MNTFITMTLSCINKRGLFYLNSQPHITIFVTGLYQVF